MYPMPSEEDNCHLVEVSETEVQNSVRSIPKLDTLILVKVRHPSKPIELHFVLLLLCNKFRNSTEFGNKFGKSGHDQT